MINYIKHFLSIIVSSILLFGCYNNSNYIDDIDDDQGQFLECKYGDIKSIQEYYYDEYISITNIELIFSSIRLYVGRTPCEAPLKDSIMKEKSLRFGEDVTIIVFFWNELESRYIGGAIKNVKLADVIEVDLKNIQERDDWFDLYNSNEFNRYKLVSCIASKRRKIVTNPIHLK